MKNQAQYTPFQNRCVVCKCERGSLGYWYTDRYEPDVLKPAHMFGHTVTTFTCFDCGAITSYEQIPVISGVWYQEKVEKE